MSPSTTTLASLPALGAEWPATDPETVSIGRFVGVITTPDGDHCALVLLHAKPEQDLTWDEAMAWAAGTGGELPSRSESALLFANAKAEFEPRWHWTREQYSAHDAWAQGFGDGFQDYGGKGYESRARAVRRFKLSA